MADEDNWLPNFSNAAALIFNNLEELNWAGFYLIDEKENELVLGPFQGLPACVRIQKGNGVCGSAWAEKKTYIVEDVHQFEGHITCDPVSKSEIVIPLQNKEILGVLDIDSPVYSRFGEYEKKYLGRFVKILLDQTKI